MQKDLARAEPAKGPLNACMACNVSDKKKNGGGGGGGGYLVHALRQYRKLGGPYDTDKKEGCTGPARVKARRVEGVIKRRGTNIKGWTSCVECLYLSATGSNSIELQTFGESDTGNSNTDREGSEELDSVKNANALLVAGLRMSDLLGKEGPSGSGATSKVYVGSGFPPLPKKLAERIQNLEFVDMAELRPVQWQEVLEPEPDPHKFVILPGLEIARAKRRQVEDVHTWSICFTTYIAAVGQKHPAMMCEMLAYMQQILRTQAEYEGQAWREYDLRFRQMAAVTGNKTWSQLDAQIYNQCLVGRARRVDQTKGAGLAVPKYGLERAGGKAKTDCCLILNRDGSCPYSTNCRYRHACRICQGRHPAAQCKRADHRS